MKLVDANVLLYAANESDPRHEVARSWLDSALSGSEPVGFAWIVLLAYLRLSTKVGIFPEPISVDEAITDLRMWTSPAIAVRIDPSPRHLDLLAGLLAETGSGGNLVNDAHLAALALEHDATVVTFDNDFSRFAGVRWETPG